MPLQEDSRAEDVPRGQILLERLENVLSQIQHTERRAMDLADGICGRKERPEEAPAAERGTEEGMLDTYVHRAQQIMRHLNSIDVELSRIEREFRG